jgi:Uma2 family endonuclease
MATILKLMTAEELLLMPDDGMQRELIRGVLTEDMPPGDEHGVLVARIAWLFSGYAEENDYGEMRAGDSGFVLEHDPDMVRGPDVAWVSPDRLAAPVVGYADLAPDLVVEVKPPSNSNREMADRAMMWLNHGTRMVVVADPVHVTLTVYRPGQPPQVLGESDTFDGGDVLPGFAEQVWRFFRRRE